jgi:multidrug efflux pump subunit AcrB
MKKPKIQLIKDGSINGKVVLLILTAIMVLMYCVLGPLFKSVKDALVAYGSQLNAFFGISAGLFWTKQAMQPAIRVVGNALAKKFAGEIPEEDGDA